MFSRPSALIALLALPLACSSGTASRAPSEAEAGATSFDSRVEAESVAPLDPAFFDVGLQDDDVFTHANPAPSQLDVETLRRVLQEAELQKSDAVVIAVGDTIVAEKYFGHDPSAGTVQSITKSVVSLAIGALIDDGLIASLDAPVSIYFPEWAVGDKAKVTLRHLASHTSGLRDDGSALFTQKDSLAYARAQGLSARPGTSFAYSNVGTMLLAGVIHQAAGMAADAFVDQRFFSPLGITQWKWEKDPAGNVDTPGGLFLTPRDLLRLGRLVREGGRWKDRVLVSAKWISESTTVPVSVSAPNNTYPCYSLLWWLLRDGCDASSSLVGKAGPIRGAVANGWGGNYIALAPARVVGVRTKAPPEDVTFADEQKTAFEAFPHQVAALGK
ncbi:MAG: hypothetical protein NVS3B20_08230 [Polyangiales bacterium]